MYLVLINCLRGLLGNSMVSLTDCKKLPDSVKRVINPQPKNVQHHDRQTSLKILYTTLTHLCNILLHLPMKKTKYLINVKLVLIGDTYCILICCYTPFATTQKRNELTLAPPWTELTLNSTGSAGNDYR